MVSIMKKILNTIMIILKSLEKEKPYHLKWDKPIKNHENNYYRCCMQEHQLHTLCNPKHLVDLYQTSIKKN